MVDSLESLKAIGFTALETEIYLALVSVPSMTAYRIAQVLQKPAANVYKGIESLVGKGAALVDDSGSKFYRAVPPKEVLAAATRRLQEDLARAEEVLTKIAEPATDERTYELLTREQVYQRARNMLKNCKEVALLDLFPEPLNLLQQDLRDCSSRGVIVAAIIYGRASIDGVQLTLRSNAASVRRRWPGQWLNLVSDGKEHLLSFLSDHGSNVLQAVWSASPYLSWIYHSALSGEMVSTQLIGALDRNAKNQELRSIVEAFNKIKAVEAPGYRALLRKFQARGTVVKTRPSGGERRIQ